MIEQTSFRSSRSWLLGDHLGSTSMVTDDDGDVVSEVRYSAFGEARYQNGTLTTDYLYTGQRQEAEVGLYYYVARWYDPAIGRFVQADSIVPDPAGAVGFDRYAYAGNNPVKYVDPSGNTPIVQDCNFYGTCTDSDGTNWYPVVPLSFPVITTTYGEIVPPGTSQSQFNIDEQACGLVVLAAIYRTSCTNGQCMSTRDLYEAASNTVPTIGGGLESWNVIKIIDLLLSYKAEGFWNKLGDMSNMNSFKQILEDDNKSLWFLKELLQDGAYPIVGVEVNRETGELSNSNNTYHWEIVVGLSPDMSEVILYNPFNNEYETHSSDYFMNHWNYPNAKLREIIAVRVD